MSPGFYAFFIGVFTFFGLIDAANGNIGGVVLDIFFILINNYLYWTARERKESGV